MPNGKYAMDETTYYYHRIKKRWMFEKKIELDVLEKDRTNFYLHNSMKSKTFDQIRNVQYIHISFIALTEKKKKKSDRKENI